MVNACAVRHHFFSLVVMIRRAELHLNSWRSMVLVALLTVLAVPAFAGRTGGCPYRAKVSNSTVARDHWAYEAAWELARGSRVIGRWDDQQSLESFSRRQLSRIQFARLTARILKYRTWRRRGVDLTPERMERLAALIAEFRSEFAALGGRPERLDLMFAQVLREEFSESCAQVPVQAMRAKCKRRAPKRVNRFPVVLGLMGLFAAGAALNSLERRSMIGTSLLASRFSI